MHVMETKKNGLNNEGTKFEQLEIYMFNLQYFDNDFSKWFPTKTKESAQL